MMKFYSLTLFLVLFNCWIVASAGSQSNLPVSKTLTGINEVPVTNLQVTLVNELTSQVLISWECTPSAGFLYYTVQRDGVQIALIPGANEFYDYLPGYGTYTYCVAAMYDTGPTTPACDAIEWAAPMLSWSPASLHATVWSHMYGYLPLTISNSGNGTLYYEFPNYADHPGDSPLAYCSAGSTTSDEFISNVQFGTINNSSATYPSGGYTSFTSISTDVVKGLSYPISVTVGPPSYSGDISGVWIDFDHNNTFDAGEFTALAGTSPATGTITIPATALSGPTTMRVRTQYNGTLSPCDTTQYGEVEDYTLVLREPTFITEVTPVAGFIAPGQTQNVTVTFSANDQYSATGVYTNELILISNDTAQPSVTIPCTMIVGISTYLQGVVTDCATGDPLSGVQVSVDGASVITNDTGFYTTYVFPGTYNVSFSKIGYQSVTIPATVAVGDTTTLNSQMCEIPYPPACAHASVNFEDTQCTVSWCPPDNLYELQYDDGTAENFAAWEFAGNRNAVKFTPQGYPAKITGVKIYIGDGPYGNAVGSTVGILVCKPDAAGLPGQVIDSAALTVLTTGWLSITGLNATITSGDFFIVMIQNNPSPNCPYLGVDETPPTVNKSYSRDMVNGGQWELSAYQDFMMRAIVSSPDTSQYRYELTRIFLGAVDPVPPENGVPTFFSNNFSSTTCVDGGSTWANLPQGWYAYGIQAHYPLQYSEHTYTNMVPHKMFADLTLNAQLECGLVPAEGAIVKLKGVNYPYYSITDTLSASGTLTFSQIIQGDYTVSVTYPDYENYSQTVSLFGNEVVNIVLLQLRNKPINLYINESTLVAAWQAPRGILLNEDFEGTTFPPAGWQVSSAGYSGWNATTNGSSDSLVIPPHTTYAVVNDQLAGAANNGCCDYLYTPILDLRGSADYTLSFSNFFNGLNGQLAYVEISTDYGATWAPLYTCELTYGIWYTKTIDLSAFSGPTGYAGVQFAFHADDAGNQASGWAIDDVSITYGGLDVSGYKVYLDGTEMGQTTGLTWAFDPATFNCQIYQAAVEAIYCTGVSNPTTCDFTNGYPYPPASLTADTNTTATSGTVILTWQEPLNCLSNVVSYRIYRNDTAYIAEVPVTVMAYQDMNLMPGTYCYKMTSVYDLTPWGFPGQFGESVFSLPACADIIYGGDLPFTDDFSGGEFDTTLWIPGQNWLVDEDSDNPVPAAKFKWDPLMTNYSSALQSNWINATETDSLSPYKIWFDFDIKLEDFTATGSEKLTVEICNGSGWNAVKEFPNTGSFDWTSEHIDITAFAKDQFFRVRFRANGLMSGEIHYWAVDNIHVFTESYLLPPMNLVVEPGNTAGNENLIVWSPPLTGNTTMSYILDDNTVEFNVYLNSTGECWLGNEFPVTESGVVKSVSVFMEANNGNAVYSIDIFDGNKSVVYSSMPFTPAFNAWTTIDLPYVAFNGTFYAMVHMVVTNNSDFLDLDLNGPNSATSLTWYTDDLLGWMKLSEFGWDPNVSFIRVNAVVGDKKTSVAFNQVPVVTNHSLPPVCPLASKPGNRNTGSEVAHATPLTDNYGAVLGYNIYRRDYSVFPPGQNTTSTGTWTMINPAVVTQTSYLDQDLSNLVNNCYEYRVTALYDNGESLPSNTDWECIFTNLNFEPESQANLFPNPASDFIRIETGGEICELDVYNSFGLLVMQKNVDGERSLILNISEYSEGIYTVKFKARKGESFSRKFVVVR